MFAHLRFTTPRTALPAAVALVISVRVGLAQAPPPMQPVTYAIKNLGTLRVPTPDLACEDAGGARPGSCLPTSVLSPVH